MAAQFGRRLRRGATTTAVAAAAVAALAASQAPAAPQTDGAADDRTAAGATPSEDSAATGNSPYHTDLPPLTTPNRPGASVNLPVTGSAEAGIPASVLAAYKKAEQELAGTDAACRLPWQLLAAIGKVESGQARGGKVDADGTTLSPILGPALNGQGFALIKDTDGGAYDNDATHDRAVGPMQFIPSTWATWGQDGNGDGRKDPNNVYDAALAAGRYLCAGTRDLSLAADLDRAVLSYNHSTEYLRTVRSWFDYYKRGTHEVPDGRGVLPAGTGGGTSSPSPTPTPTPPGTASPSPVPTPPGQSPSPSPDPTPPPTPKPPKPPTTPPTPPATLGTLENAGTGTLTATAGETFAERVTVRARSTTGTPFAKAPVTFAVVGDTDTRFAGGKSTVTVTTGSDGTVTAPALTAGEKTGSFRVTAVAGTAKLRTLTFTANVTARVADTLTRTDDKVLTAAPGAAFADRVQVEAAYKGTGVADTAVTATMITDAETPAENDKGPYFKDADGKAVRTLDLTTGADGLLELPTIHADDTAGTFTLRLTTASGATLTVELKVEAPAA
ncbi:MULTISPECIES: lytic murein transglycosylase [unclassified Streptomyces]|uniref:lytic murein transglycosylase n=1 Tax=unclassified Streptomyces TaxID=2593676 RepID=UPI0035DA4C5D